MFRRNLIPVWLGILLLSGMFLMGQDAWSPKSGSCTGHPCVTIPNALPNSCVDVGEGEFTCDCVEGYFWEEIGNTCEDPCLPNPCDAIDNALAGSCAGISAEDFACDCNEGFFWNNPTNTCEEPQPPCLPDPCQEIPNGIPGTCEPMPSGPCAPSNDFTCGCLAGFLWEDSSNTCEPVDSPCDPDPCAGITNAVAGTCVDEGGGDFSCTCDAGYVWEESSNTCEEAVPQFPGGSYEMSATDILQDPAACLMTQVTVILVRPILRSVIIPLDIPSGEVIVNFFGNAYPLDIPLPVFGSITVILSLDGTYENMLMDGPDVYVADTSGLLPFPGADCVITGSADGIFTDINTEPLTGSLTIDIASVEDSPGGVCSLLKKPTEPCAITLLLDAGVPL